MKQYKPTLDDIIATIKRDELYYQGEVLEKFIEDERYYELDFAELLDIPIEFKNEGIVLPTARDMVDTFVDHIDIANARVSVNKKGISTISAERAEMLRKFYLGLIYRTNVESSISPWRIGAKHYALHGLTIFKTVWDADRWADKPIQKEGESEDKYAERIDEWRGKTQETLPIVIQAIHPYNVTPDPHYGGELYVFEKRRITCFEAKNRWPHWKNLKGVQDASEVFHYSFWTKEYRCELIDDEPILKVRGGVTKHNYGFIPYVFIESGLGNLSREAKPSMRYVGMLRYMTDLLIAESRDFTVADVILKREAWKGGYLTGPGAKAATKLSMKYGEYTYLPEGVEVHHWERNLPPDMLNSHLARTSDYIAAHAAPRSVRGLSESGVRSGADRRLIIAEASARYQYSKDAFKNGTAKVLTNCARLLKNVIPGDIRVWGKTPADENAFDEIVKKDKMKEPFTCYVEFAPISEEDEYRRHDDLERLVSSGLVTRKWGRTQMSNVDPIAMELEEEKEKLKNDPNLQAVITQYAGARLNEALAQIGIPPVTGAPPEGEEAGRRLVPPITERAPLGSAQDIQNQLQQMRSPTPMSPTQGQGGGGFRP